MNDVGTWEVITLSCICVILLVCQRISVVSSPVSQLCCVCVFGYRKEIELAHSETDLQAGRSSWWRWHEAVKPEPSFYISVNACDSLFLNQSPNTNAWNYANKQTLGDIYCNVNDTVLWSSTCATDSHKPFFINIRQVKWVYLCPYVCLRDTLTASTSSCPALWFYSLYQSSQKCITSKVLTDLPTIHPWAIPFSLAGQIIRAGTQAVQGHRCSCSPSLIYRLCRRRDAIGAYLYWTEGAWS